MKPSNFSKWVFFSYLSILTIIFIISRFASWVMYIYWFIILTILVLQISNMVMKKYVDNKTKYKDSLLYESEKLRFVFAYFGFPIVLLFPDYFREIRKDSYYVRRLKELGDLIKMYEKSGITVNEEVRSDWTICNRYLKLKKLKNHEDSRRV